MIGVVNLVGGDSWEDFFRKTAETVLSGEGKGEEAELSFVLAGSRRMRTLNYRYRGKNKITDVLSFGPVGQEGFAGAGKFVGEVILCSRRIRKNAKQAGRVFTEEMARCLIHGILHLLEYEHDSGAEKAMAMEEKQEKYLRLCFKTNLSLD